MQPSTEPDKRRNSIVTSSITLGAANSIRPVSYTHLDVYKRQPFDLSSVTATTTSLVFNQTAADPEGVGTSWYIFATPGLPPGRNPKLSDYRYIAAPAAATTGFPAPVSYTHLRYPSSRRHPAVISPASRRPMNL